MSQHNTNIVLPKQSFIAVINYKPSTRELFVVLRANGRRYRYKEVSAQVFDAIMASSNKGNYIAQNIIHGGYQFDEMAPVPMATLGQIIGSKYANPKDNYTNRYYWLGI
jgi:hypothetical protein